MSCLYSITVNFSDREDRTSTGWCNEDLRGVRLERGACSSGG